MRRLPFTLLSSPRQLSLNRLPLKLSPCLLSLPRLSQFYVTEAPSNERSSRRLDFNAIDEKWREYLNNPKDSGNEAKKFYILSMFPYPSGTLHMGHLRVYTISDVLARYQRMRGNKVVHPMGWDAFGLPAENAAIERGVNAREWTEKNIDSMKEQLSLMGVGFDWDREIRTCSPDYYVHTQRLFLKLYEHGLAYRAESLVNWDPVDNTVLANEQVSPRGISWRSGAVVEKRSLPQWFFKITAFKDPLLKGLETLGSHWPTQVITMQKNWIGESKGVKITFPVTSEKTDLGSLGRLDVYTTRLDTLHGVQFLAISSTHPLAIKAAESDEFAEKFLLESGTKWNPRSKKGQLLMDIKAWNPLNNEEIPIYIANYVVDGYGTGGVMGVPGHDARDKAFWERRGPKDAPIKVVVEPDPADRKQTKQKSEDGLFTKSGILNQNCGKFARMTSENAQIAILKALEKKQQGTAYEQIKLKDWLVSRQRYWGTPIPMVHCDSCGIVPVKEEDLPVVLPEIEKVTSKGGNPLASVKEWVETTCPSCGAEAKRETDTMDTFVDSSWYFMRYVDPHNKEMPFSPEKADQLLPVDAYVGGIEHAILHLLYSRFIAKFMHKSGMWPSGGGCENMGEPFKRLVTQGMVLGKTHRHPDTSQFIKPEDIIADPATGLKLTVDGVKPIVGWEKMSKSKFNGTDPRECIRRWGADATRAHLLFLGPVEAELQWDEDRIIGIHRWFDKLWRHMRKLSPQLAKDPGFMILPNREQAPVTHENVIPGDRELFNVLQGCIRDTSFALSRSLSLNTVVSNLIKLTNALTSPTTEATLSMQYRTANALVRMMAPIAPGFAEECWEELHAHVPLMAGTRALQMRWPWFVLHGEELGGTTMCAIHIDGKFGAKVCVEREKLLRGHGAGEAYIREIIEGDEGARECLVGKEIKFVYIAPSGKVVSLSTRLPRGGRVS